MPVSPSPVLSLSPSLIAASPLCLQDAVTLAAQAGAEALHIDIMDGHFVPNITFGPSVIKALRPVSPIFFDVHLMVKNPQQWIAPFCDAGANAITIHAESTPDWPALLQTIKQHGRQAGIAINPKTDLDFIPDNLWPHIDRLLLMTVEPGFSGQTFLPLWDKIHQAALLKLTYPHLYITVDGGVNNENIAQLAQSGIDNAIIGSAFYHQTQPLDAWADLQNKKQAVSA